MNLIDSLKHKLLDHGDMPFVEFMQQALYAPGLGYYSAGLQKFGVSGDFITAPELTPLFGQTLASQCQQIMQQFESSIIFEFGAGSGRLCVDLLTQLEQLNCLPEEYHILEVSDNLRQRQLAYIEQHIPHLCSRIKWLYSWPAQAFKGVIIANEVLDAMPIHRFLQTQEGILESFISLNTDNTLVETYKPSQDARLLKYLQHALPNTLYPYQSEANLFIEDWMQQCHNMLQQGAMFIIDYGFPRHEYYHPDRISGTLMCHYQHLTHSNPLAHPGEEDITAHVDFTHIAESADLAGFHVAGFCNQASFLLANGILSLLSQIDNAREKLKAQNAVKQLIQSSEMGELFKVMALTKEMNIPLNGFQLHDKRASL